MGCGCGKNKNKKNNKKSDADNKTASQTLSLKRTNPKLFEQRKNICSNCEQSTKFIRNGKKTLTAKSICKVSNQHLNKVLRDPKFSCPLDYFSSE